MIRPKFMTAVSVGLWAAAASTLLVDLPGRHSEDLLFALALAATILQRTRRSDHMRTMYQVAYNQGVHDTLKRSIPAGYGERPHLGQIG